MVIMPLGIHFPFFSRKKRTDNPNQRRVEEAAAFERQQKEDALNTLELYLLRSYEQIIPFRVVKEGENWIGEFTVEGVSKRVLIRNKRVDLLD